MSARTYYSELDRAIAAARAAGRLALDAWRGELDVRHKAADQPVTDADLAADRLIRATLLDAFPDDGWLSEESADDAARLARRRVWVVDPIDGTRSFVARRPEFTISIGLVEDGAPVVGVVLNPATGELFHAVRGGGAFRSAAGDTHRLTVRPATAGRGVLLASRGEIAAGEHAPFADDWDIAPVGSTAYKLARIAAGEADGYVSRGPKSEWDVAAGVLLVDEAGGRATDLRGGRPRFNRPLPEIAGIVAAGGVYDRLSALAGALPTVERLRHRVPDALHPGLEGSEA